MTGTAVLARMAPIIPKAPWARMALVPLLALLVAGCAGTPTSRPSTGTAAVSDLAGRCSQREDDGFREDARLDIRDGQVQHLVWNIQVGRRGSCHFHLDQFSQVRQRPHIEMQARDGSGCRLLVYGDTRRITLGHTDCERQCSGGVVDEAWPVMFDPRTGACARLDAK